MTADPRYPIGKFSAPGRYDAEAVAGHLRVLAELPGRLRDAVDGLDEGQLDTPYREGGWTVRQLVHHVADSHMNSYIRGRLALTEDRPGIMAYDEKKWAELADARTEPIEPSLQILEGVHRRWVALWSTLDRPAWDRALVHPEYAEPITLWWLAALYDWHSRHHVAHVTELRRQRDW